MDCVKVDFELAQGIIVTVVETGYSWFRFRDYDPDNAYVTVIDEEGNIYPLDQEILQEAVDALEVGPGGDVAEWFMQYFPEDYDVDTADAVVQKAVFGEVIYG